MFRPFNWIGPRLDSLYAAKEGSSRVVTQFIAGSGCSSGPFPLKLAGGNQRRCFTYINDGISALVKILANKDDACKTIINIGNPYNDCSVAELAAKLKKLFMEHPNHRNDAAYSEIIEVPVPELLRQGISGHQHTHPEH